MKVLFLDVDGVLNKQENFNPSENKGPWPIDDYCVFLVGRIQLNTDCSIVVSSSWRHHPDGMRTIREKFLNVIGKTPLYGNTRGHEIAQWLEDHQDVNQYAILDDDSDMLPEQMDHFFKTTFESGLTEEIAEKVTKYLNS